MVEFVVRYDDTILKYFTDVVYYEIQGLSYLILLALTLKDLNRPEKCGTSGNNLTPRPSGNNLTVSH